jgi:hypothetical protein
MQERKGWYGSVQKNTYISQGAGPGKRPANKKTGLLMKRSTRRK